MPPTRSRLDPARLSFPLLPRTGQRAVRLRLTRQTLLCLKIPALRRGERGELAAVGFQVDERCPIEAIETPDKQCRPLTRDEGRERCSDRVRADRRAQRECTPR